MKKIIALLILIVVVVLVYFAFGSSTTKKQTGNFLTVPVERGTLTAEVMSSGTLKPLNEVIVGSQVSGTIKELHADYESRVEQGQLIALIDPAMFKAKVNQARADLEAAQASLDKAEVTLEDELRDLKRQEKLLDRKSISQSEFDAAKTQADAAQAQVAVEKSRVAQMEARLREAELQLSYTRIDAPVNGVVISRNIDVGQTIAANFQAPEIFTIAEDLTKMQVHANVDEADIGRVEVGQKSSFTVPAFPDRVFQASVTQIRNEPTVEQNVVTYTVVLDVDNGDLKLRPGMTANVRILLEKVDDTLMLPDQALRFKPGRELRSEEKKLGPLKKGEKRLWRLEDDETLTPIAVKLGIQGVERVQILSDELKPGDRIIVEKIDDSKGLPKRRGIRFKF